MFLLENYIENNHPKKNAEGWKHDIDDDRDETNELAAWCAPVRQW